MPQEVTVLCFGPARQAAGTSRFLFEVPSAGIRSSELVAALAQARPRLRPTLQVSRFLLNGEVIGPRARRARPGDEFAIHPPYGGG